MDFNVTMAPNSTDHMTCSSTQDIPNSLQLITCPDNLAIDISDCTRELTTLAVEKVECFVKNCKNGIFDFKGSCGRCLCEVIHSAARDLDVVIATIKQAIADRTPYPILIRQIEAIGPPANVFFTRLNYVLEQSLAPLRRHWFGITVGLGVGATALFLCGLYLRRDAIILERRSSADGTGHEYLFQSRYSFRGNAWYAASSLSAASRELAFEFDTIINTPKEIVAKRAIDHNGNECDVESAAGLQYLVRSEGWRIGCIEDVWVGQQQLERDQWMWPMVCRFEAEVGNARTIVQAVPFEWQQPADGGRARDALGRFV